MKDNRVAVLATADEIAKWQFIIQIRKPIFIFRGVGPTKAIYVFGKRVYSKGWTG